MAGGGAGRAAHEEVLCANLLVDELLQELREGLDVVHATSAERSAPDHGYSHLRILGCRVAHEVPKNGADEEDGQKQQAAQPERRPGHAIHKRVGRRSLLLHLVFELYAAASGDAHGLSGAHRAPAPVAQHTLQIWGAISLGKKRTETFLKA